MIRFETFQLVSFALTASLFVYMTVAFISWFIRSAKPKKVSMRRRYGVM